MGSVKQPCSTAIIGAGIGGIALAIGLLKQGVSCTIYEAAPKFDAVGAGEGFGEVRGSVGDPRFEKEQCA
jgi:salicylate hydroxylase